MEYEFDITLQYGRGQLEPVFDGEDYPENWSDIISSAKMQVKEELYEIAPIHEWRDSFETAQEYSMPGMSPEPEVGTITVTENGVSVNLSIETIDDCEWM